MIQNPHLDAIIAKETFEEMLTELTPSELAVAALRLDDLTFGEAAELLGLNRKTVYLRMRCARLRLAAQFPHVRSWLMGQGGGGAAADGPDVRSLAAAAARLYLEEDAVPEIAVYDAGGEVCSLDWLRDKYGPFIIYKPPSLPPGESARRWAITALRERSDAPSSIVVRTLDHDRAPASGIKVAWYWPDAPADPGAGPLGAPFEGVTPARAVHGHTNSSGEVGFAMGSGAYYYPDRGERGPHATWIHGAGTRSDLILGLGMRAATNHDHIDVEFSLVDEVGGNEHETELLELLGQIVEQLARIAAALEAATIALEASDNG